MAEIDELTMEAKNTDNPYRREGGAVPSTSKVVGDKEAEALGLYEKEGGVKELLGIANPEQLNQELITGKKEQIQSDTTARNKFEARSETDRGRMESAHRAMSAGPGSLPPPWDADKERQDRVRGPIEQFGSIGMVFAMGASMFTRTPMTSALNAGADAMAAIKASDEKGYESAYTAWKDNTDLTIKRFNMENQLFNSAQSLFNTDQAQWKSTTAANLARFDDKKGLAFLEAGMNKEYFELIDSRAKSISAIVKAKDEMETTDIRQKLLKAEKTPEGKLRVMQQMAAGEGTVEVQLLRAKRAEYRAEHGKDMPPDEQATFISDFRQSNRKLSDSEQLLTQWQEEFNTREGRYPNAEETKAFMASMPGKGGVGAGGVGRQVADLTKQLEAKKIADGMDPIQAKKEALKEATEAVQKPTTNAEIEKRTDEIIKKAKDEGKPIPSRTEANNQARQELGRANAAMTANKRVELQTRYDKFEHSISTIDKTLGVLQKYSGSAGLAGKVMRVEEMIENIAAKGKISQTDRKQMQRDIELLMGWAKPLLFDKAGKGLKDEYSSLRTIIPGLGAGDTTANTIRGLSDMKKLFGQLQGETKTQLEGNWTPDTSKSSVVPDVEKTKPRWQDAPLVNP